MEKWRTIGKKVKGGVLRLMGTLRGFAFSREAALPLRGYVDPFPVVSSRRVVLWWEVISQHRETELPLGRSPPALVGVRACVLWGCGGNVLLLCHIWVILERMILEVKEVCFHWCHLVHPPTPWSLHRLIGDCTDSVSFLTVLQGDYSAPGTPAECNYQGPPWKGLSRLACDTPDSSELPGHSCPMRASD